MIRCLSPLSFPASTKAKTDPAIQPKQVAVGYFNRPAKCLPSLLADAVCQQYRRGVFQLNEKISQSRKVLLQRHDFHAVKQSRRVKTLLALEQHFGVVRRAFIEFGVAADDLVLCKRISCNEDPP